MSKHKIKKSGFAVLSVFLASCMQSPNNVPVYNIEKQENNLLASNNIVKGASSVNEKNTAFEDVSSEESIIEQKDFTDSQNYLTPVFEPENAIASNTGTFSDFNKKLDYKINSNTKVNSSSTSSKSSSNTSSSTSNSSSCYADYNFASNLPRDENGLPDYKQIKKGVYKAPVYLVQKGDSLYRVAYLSAKTEAEIKRFNNLETNDVKAGFALAVDSSCSVESLGTDTFARTMKSIEDNSKKSSNSSSISPVVKNKEEKVEVNKAQDETANVKASETKAKLEAEVKAKQEAEAKEKIDAEAKSKAEALQQAEQEKARLEAEAERVKQEAAAKLREEQEAFAKAKAEAQAKIEAEKARLEAERAALVNTSKSTTTIQSPTSAGNLSWPASGKLISTFTNNNRQPATRGISIGGKQGDKILAAESGQVIFAGSQLEGYGNLVIIKHSSDLITLYAHNSKLLVKVGDRVSKGQQIALMGSSATTINKLYFEVRHNSVAVDPLKYLEAR